MTTLSEEVAYKLARMHEALHETGATAIRLRGTDWFAWATAGASNSVLLAAETGIAEVFVTLETAWILTDEIEAQRLIDEQRIDDFQLHITPWAEVAKREAFVREASNKGKILSDRPTLNESTLPAALLHHKRILLPSEIDRYRRVGRLASEAMTEAMSQAQPTWTESELAGAGAAAMWSRGLHPALTLVAGERRLPLYRHPLPTQEAIGRVAMMVFCARGAGLYANLTRFIHFGSLSSEQGKLHEQVREIEAVALHQSQPDTQLNSVYQSIAQAYQQHGFPQAIREHHQGGTTGYLAREVVANPETNDPLMSGMAIAWNPSLPGAKMEDTFVLQADGTLENLTFDPNWISVNVEGHDRPIPLELD
ncbi:MAG: M24 family metallopeptidase [Leptolyngbyaceae cyanobacterium SM1_3_5]|nr:M24 family metallopeptidase [Leptolyngbyaceae cyanobacterium SM1_3_5]